MFQSGQPYRYLLALSLSCLACAPAQALNYSLPLFGGEQLDAVLNTNVTMGVGIRMQAPSVNLIGKSNLNPNVCAGPNGAYQDCQGLFRDQIYPSRQLVKAPGAASVNHDDGDLNYKKYQPFSAPLKVTSDLTLSFNEFGVFGRASYFYDFVNKNFSETHPNRVTAQNALQVGRHVAPMLSALTPAALRACAANPNPLLSPVQNLLLNGRDYGQPDGKGQYVVYGRGGYVRSKRSDPEVLREVGSDLQLLDSYFYGKLPIPFTDGKQLSFKLGRQLVNWGESTTLAINSVNQANPINANNVYRIGGQVEEFFTPINMVDLSFSPINNTTIEGFYQLEWQPLVAPAPGSYFSDADIGTHNAIGQINAGFGGGPEDPDCLARPKDNPLAGITPTCTTIKRLADREPRSSGQYGIKLDYYADWLGNGTDVSGYYMHYHSRLPIFSMMSADASCLRKAGNSQHVDATSLLDLIPLCPDIPLLHALTHPNSAPAQYATDSAVEFDSARFFLEYPEDIDLYGLSFNTTLGEYSLQGEVAFRPNLPLQVDEHDLAFAAYGPTLSNCMDPHSGRNGSGCVTGDVPGIGFTENGGTKIYNSGGNFVPAPGKTGFNDSFDLLIGGMTGSARAFPNFIIPYRGGVIGENPANSYLRGYERFKVFEFNLGGTRVLGASDNPFGADQVLLVGEAGATYVPELPSYNKLVLQGPGVNYGPTAGADGSGADGGRRSCAGSAECSYGPDGGRFNPHQQDATGYPDKISWGYRAIAIFRYENVLPKIGLTPSLVFKHDVQGTAPSPAPNFVAGRKEVDFAIETRYKTALSLSLGYTWFWGGGVFNTLSDRDFAQAFVKYQF